MNMIHDVLQDYIFCVKASLGGGEALWSAVVKAI